MPIRIVLVDDHQIVLHGLQQLFARQADFEVLHCCSDGASAIDAVLGSRPDVLVLDLRMPDQSGLDVLRALAAKGADCRSVLLTAAVRDEEVAELVVAHPPEAACRALVRRAREEGGEDNLSVQVAAIVSCPLAAARPWWRLGR